MTAPTSDATTTAGPVRPPSEAPADLVVALAGWAYEQDAWAATYAAVSSSVRTLEEYLILAWQRLVRTSVAGPRQRPTEVTLGRWLAAVVAAPREQCVSLVHLLTRATADSGPRWVMVEKERERTRQRWLAVGEAGPYAYAAGLDIAEATRQSGRLDIDVLRGLAALRGWRFPPGY